MSSVKDDKPENNGAIWCNDQDEWLLKAIKIKDQEYCAEKMKRTVGSIIARLLKHAHIKIVNEKKDLEDTAKELKLDINCIKKHFLYIAYRNIIYENKDINIVSKELNIDINTINEYIKITNEKREEALKNKELLVKKEELENKKILNNTKIDDDMPKSIILSEQQNNVLEKFKEGLNIFLSGEAGTRKTVTINEIIKYCKALKKALKNKELLVKKEELENKKILDNTKIDDDMPKSIILSEQQRNVLEKFKEGCNIFLSGEAGTGKTVTINEIIKYCRNNNINYGITASTGAAAVLINGNTLHSFLGIGDGSDNLGNLYNRCLYKYKNIYKKLNELNVLIIDEISMISEELFTKISKYLSFIRKDARPFGGVQLLICGDFYQLPPVNGNYCFESDIWDKCNFKYEILKKNYRQSSDNKLQSILTNIRNNNITREDIDILERCKNTIFTNDIKPTKIFSKNYIVDNINEVCFKKQLEKVNYNKYIYDTEYKNKKSKNYCDKYGIPDKVTLCIGLQVILNTNIDVSKYLVNGLRGIIVSLDKENVYIKTQIHSYNIKINKVKILRENNTICYNIMPVIPGYAITVHKSQGVTLDAAEIDIGDNIFEYGQAYTALSRIKSLDSLKIVNVKKESFMNNRKVIDFYNKIKN